jgi:PAS domain S-box-containing protein
MSITERLRTSGRPGEPEDAAHVIEEATLQRAIDAKTIASLPQAELVRRLGIAASAAGALVVLLGSVVLVGWIADVPSLYRLSPDTASTKFSTALALTLLGLAVLISHVRQPWAPRVTSAIAVVVGAYAVLTVSEYALDTTYPWDNLLGLDPGDLGGDSAGRMSLATAVGVLLVAVAIWLVDRGQVMAGQLVASSCLVVGMVTLVGYAYGVESLYTLGAFKSIALRTAVGLVLASLGVLLRRSDGGYMSLISGNTAGGIIVRRFLPVATLVPITGGLAVVHLGDTGTGDNSAALIAVAATLVGVIGSALVWLQSSRLRQVDLRRAGAEDAFTIAREAIEARDAIAEELAASQRRTRAIIASSTAAYISFGPDGVVDDCNSAALNLFGLPLDAVLGRRASDLVTRSTVDGSRSQMMAYLAGEGPPPGDQRYEAAFVTQDGRNLTVDIALWTLTDESQLSFHAFISDVTDRKQVEVELRRANDDLADFSAAMAHDLRTPLTVVKGFSSMLRGSLEGTREEDFVARIEGAADRGSRLIDDILAFAQIGREALSHRPVELTTLAEHVAAELVVAADRPADVRVDPLPRVSGDEALMRTMLSNFIGNAIKYVPADRNPVVVVDSVVDAETGWPVIRVSDNGDALTDTDRLFKMFERGAADDRTVGSGVGLAVCRRIAELHGGRAWLETSEEGGPRFCVLLSGAP